MPKQRSLSYILKNSDAPAFFKRQLTFRIKTILEYDMREYVKQGFKMTDLMLEIAKTEGVWYTSASIINENFIDVYIRTGSGENFIKDVSIRIHEKLLQYGTNYKD